MKIQSRSALLNLRPDGLRQRGKGTANHPSQKLTWLGGIIALAAFLCTVLLCLTASQVYADDPTFTETHLFGPGDDDTRSLATADLNGDGALDIVAGNSGWSGEQNAVYLNDGAGNFDWPGASRDFGPGDDKTASVAVGDMNGDGVLDIVVGNLGQQNKVYLNDGTGSFPGTRDFGPGDDATAGVAVGDMNGDGDLDIVVGNGGGPNMVYLNDGDGNFDWPGAAYPFGTGADATSSIALGDLDGNDYLDIAVGDGFGQNVVYLNDGLVSFPITSPFGSGVDITQDVVVGDINGDGALDIAVGNANNIAPSSGNRNYYYLNDGTGDFDWPGAEQLLGNVWDWTYGLAIGDLDGNGSLDIVVGNSSFDVDDQNLIYLNDGSGGFAAGLNLGPGTDSTMAVAVADVNDDGALDVIVANHEQQNVVWLNDGGGSFKEDQLLFESLAHGLAVGDVDKNGALDFVIGGDYWLFAGSLLYLNDGSATFPITRHIGADGVMSLALGDVDGDSYLDLVATRYLTQNLVYLNDGEGKFYTDTVNCQSPPPNVRCFGGIASGLSVTLGDVDSDGDLDIAIGNGGWPVGQSMLYLNDGDGNYDWPGAARTIGSSTDAIRSMAFGDVDGDGDLDLAVGERDQPNLLYLNDGTGNLATTRPLGLGSEGTYDIAMGDMNGDGHLDVVVGNNGQHNLIHLNDGDGSFSATQFFGTGFDSTEALDIGDIDGDGDLDIYVGNGAQFESGEPNYVYLNDGAGNFAVAREVEGAFWTKCVALGDLNTDGTLDLIEGSGGWMPEPGRFLLNRIRQPERLDNHPPYLTVIRPGTVADAHLYSTPEVLESLTIPIAYTLFDTDTNPIDIQAYYSPDGGGKWLPALAASSTPTTGLAASRWPTGTSYIFSWDTFASGFFGQSDNVVFRLEAYPSPFPHTSTVPGPFQWPYASATTFPFRVRGTQVRVFSDTVPLEPVEDALVYRLPHGQSPGEPIADPGGRPFHTSTQGYLQGRGEVKPGDQLVALLPISATDNYTLYYTSAAPTATGVDADEVMAPGVQTLTVSADNPLILLNLDVSLQWDARGDEQYLAQLDFDLQRASAFLYDWTNGQMALGDVRIYLDRQQWAGADVRIYASNRLRPNAIKGGIVSDLLDDPEVEGYGYRAGQVHVPAMWNRYGESGSSVGEDWPRALAHELGHYALYLDDNYLGLNENGLMTPIFGCTGAMSDPYREDYPYGEFHAQDANWLDDCQQTLSHQTTGRADWATITTFYGWLNGNAINAGPSSLPLAVTQLEIVEPVTPTEALADPTFYLLQDGAQIQPGVQARAFLFQDDAGPGGDWLVDLGRPTQNRVLARGARVGDRLCVIEPPADRLGCTTIDLYGRQMELTDVIDWQPDVIVSPVTSRTVVVTVTNVPADLPVRARLYPLRFAAGPGISLTSTEDGHVGTFNSDEPVLAGHVQVWVDEPEPRREIVTDYSLGGNPETSISEWRLASSHAPSTASPNSTTPVGLVGISADAQVLIYGKLDFDPGEFIALQAATTMPSPLPWATAVGHAYRLLATDNAPDLMNASITFHYMGNEVLPGEEPWLRVYFWTGMEWQQLPTELDTHWNTASAPVQGKGLYALMSSVEIPLQGPGWNLVSYPVQETRPVTEALLSIDGFYATVYGYLAPDLLDPWKLYDVDVPDWVNDLEALEFGHGYWISVTEAITLAFTGNQQLDSSLPSPPSTLYGRVHANALLTPAAGMTLTAWIDGHLCGQTVITDVAGFGLAYALDVVADDGAQSQGCGAPGRTIMFQIGSHSLGPLATWNNSRPREWPLMLAWRTYLPLASHLPPQ